MVIKLYYSSISGNKEVKTQQQHALFVMGNKCNAIDFKSIDICDPLNQEELDFYLANAQPNEKGVILPPQFFNEEEYCGNYDAFALAIETEELFQFLKLEAPKPVVEEQRSEEETKKESDEDEKTEVTDEIKEDSEETKDNDDELEKTKDNEEEEVDESY